MNKLFNKYAFLTLGFLAILVFSTNISAQTRTEILIVADQKAACTYTGETRCLQVKRLTEEKFSNFFGNIENFRFIPDYFYVLEVRVTGESNTPQTKYRLKKVLARVKSETNVSPNQPNFFGTEWKLTHIEGNAINNDKAFIRFDETKKSAGGNGGCNGFGGNFSKNGSQLKISQIISTKMFCENGSDVENKFFTNLDRVTNYEIKNGKLFLMTNQRVVLEFEEKN